MSRKCKIHDCSNEAEWSMQPFGPDEKIVFCLPGSHYRGFPVVAVCGDCKHKIEDMAATRNRKIIATFSYKGQEYGISYSSIREPHRSPDTMWQVQAWPY